MKAAVPAGHTLETPKQGLRIRPRILPFARPDITEEEITAVTRVLRSGWLTAGPETAAFEEEFARAVGADHAIAVNSATAALHLGMIAWNLGPDDAVIVPSITFTATAEVVTYSGALPLVVDVSRGEYLLDAGILSDFVSRQCTTKNGTLMHKKTGRRIRGMVPVHLAGRPCEMKALRRFAREHRIEIMEDAAHAYPCRYEDEIIGSTSPLAAFSFYATKNLTTGEGGMLTLSSARLAKKLRMVRLHGIKGQTYGRKRWNYDVVEQGFKYNMTDVAAAMGRVQLARSTSMLERRKSIEEKYRSSFAGLPGIQMMQDSRHEHSHHLFTVEITPEAGITRNRFVEEMFARGIATSLHFIPIYRHSFYKKKYGYKAKDFPNSEAIYQRIVSLPLSSSMSHEDVDDVIHAVTQTLARN